VELSGAPVHNCLRRSRAGWPQRGSRGATFVPKAIRGLVQGCSHRRNRQVTAARVVIPQLSSRSDRSPVVTAIGRGCIQAKC
jgi:hypothetical protein